MNVWEVFTSAFTIILFLIGVKFNKALIWGIALAFDIVSLYYAFTIPFHVYVVPILGGFGFLDLIFFSWAAFKGDLI